MALYILKKTKKDPSLTSTEGSKKNTFDTIRYGIALYIDSSTVINMKSLFFVLLTSLITMTTAGQSNELNKLIDQYHTTQAETNAQRAKAWPRLSATALKDALESKKKFKNSLDLLDRSNLTQQELINLELLQLIINNEIENQVYGAQLFPLNSEGGFLTSMIYEIESKRLNSDEAIAQYKSLLEDTPQYIDNQIRLMKQGLTEDKVMPHLIANNCLTILNQLINDDLNFVKAPLNNQELSNDATMALESIIDTKVLPSMVRLQKFFEQEYLTKTKKIVGIGQCTDGKSYYEQRVQYFTTLNMTPQEVFEIGNQEVKRIKKEMLAIIASLDYDGSFYEFLDFLRTDPQFYAKTPQELLNQAAWLSIKAQEILPRYFTILPSLPLTVNPVPAAIAPTYTSGRYSGGSFASRKAGEYWVNTYNLSARPTYVLPALTLHEAVPGHHLQISLTKELDLPYFRKNQYLSAFGEGWGLYAEYLGKEAGIYTTPYEDFGRLTYEMWRACRLVVDPGIHYYGWTREQAIQFMKENTALSIHEINTEIDRYIGWPGQAVSYKIGELKIRELRQRAEKELGEKFDIRAFHDLLISNGSIPLSSLERIVESYIAKQE